jgi:hypothetical protein
MNPSKIGNMAGATSYQRNDMVELGAVSAAGLEKGHLPRWVFHKEANSYLLADGCMELPRLHRPHASV